MRVWVTGEGDGMTTRPAAGPITIHQLMTHTSGLTYGFLEETPVDALYRDRKVEFNAKSAATSENLETMTARLAALPLIADPGTRWNYSNSTDVLGRLVEVIAGQSLDTFFADRIFRPLGMTDTGFSVPAGSIGRFAALYGVGEDGGYKRLDGIADSYYAGDVTLFSGGGGLVSTIGDYFRFTEFLRRKGELDGVRLLGRKTVEFMTSNQLPGDLAEMGQPVFAETTYEGIGFGLGFSVMLDPAKAKIIGSPGEYAWGGAASTAFWIDPLEDMTVIFMTQLLPSSAYPLRRELRVLTYQALID
jgi:CubicO group peptidase (beta-lactamase class C family)